MLAEQTPKRLYQARGKLYELLTNCIPAEVRPGVVVGLLGAVTKAGMGGQVCPVTQCTLTATTAVFIIIGAFGANHRLCCGDWQWS